MVRSEAERRQSAHPEVPVGENPQAVWGVRGIMARDILPDGPTERRRRSRLRALRAVDRLGLLGEGNLIAALAARPGLRWLADEEGARWAVLAELGRIGDPRTFEQAVGWVLKNRPRPEEAAAYVRRLRPGAQWPDDAAPEACGSGARQTTPDVPRLRGTSGKEEKRRC